MAQLTLQKQTTSDWEQFCNWVTSTENRLYCGWFGVLMIPCLLAATTCFIIAFIAAPPVDMMELENQSQAPLCGATTSSLGQSSLPATLSDCTSTLYGKLPVLTNGSTTEVHTSSLCFTSLSVLCLTWDENGNCLTD